MVARASTAPTPRDTLYRDGRGSVFRFRSRALGGGDKATHAPVLLVPSMLQEWYVLDRRHGRSVAAALCDGTPWETYCLDWGVPEEEDRYVEWDDIVARLGRAVRFVQRTTGQAKVALIGYSMGATLAAIHAALRPESVAAFVNIAGPIDFSSSGQLGAVLDRRWFDADAVASAGNIGAVQLQMQSAVCALRPARVLSRWMRVMQETHDVGDYAASPALDLWPGEGIPFPAAAYATYVRELYQGNRLVRGEHWVGGERVDLSRITCPHLSVVATADSICPAASTTALGEHTRSVVKDVLGITGGHVGAVTGPRAAIELYPHLVAWLTQHATRDATFARIAQETSS